MGQHLKWGRQAYGDSVCGFGFLPVTMQTCTRGLAWTLFMWGVPVCGPVCWSVALSAALRLLVLCTEMSVGWGFSFSNTVLCVCVSVCPDVMMSVDSPVPACPDRLLWRRVYMSCPCKHWSSLCGLKSAQTGHPLLRLFSTFFGFESYQVVLRGCTHLGWGGACSARDGTQAASMRSMCSVIRAISLLPPPPPPFSLHFCTEVSGTMCVPCGVHINFLQRQCLQL